MTIKDVLSRMCQFQQGAVVVLTVARDDILGIIDGQGNFNERPFHDCYTIPCQLIATRLRHFEGGAGEWPYLTGHNHEVLQGSVQALRSPHYTPT